MVQVPKSPRKLKRFIENETYAKDARFWMTRPNVGLQITQRELRPINKQALHQMGRGRRKGKKIRNVKVYVVRFTGVADESLTFLKIGITSSDIEIRFEQDVGRYRCDVVHQIKDLTRSDARSLEAALHSFFRPHKFRPPYPLLSGGNSECFSYSAKVEQQMKEVVDRWYSSAGRASLS